MDDAKPLSSRVFYWTLGILVSVAVTADSMRWQAWETHWANVEKRWEDHQEHAHADAVTKEVFSEYRKANSMQIQLLREENKAIKETLRSMQTDIRHIRERLAK